MVKSAIVISAAAVLLTSLPCLANNDEIAMPEWDQAKVLSLLEAHVDLSKPADRGAFSSNWVINTEGLRLENFSKYPWIRPFSQGLASVEGKKDPAESESTYMDNTGRGYIDTKGTLVIPTKFSNALDFSEGLAWIWNNSVFKKTSRENGYIDHTGQQVIKNRNFYEGKEFSEGLAAVRVRMSPKEKDDGRLDGDNLPGKWGYTNKAGILSIAPRFDAAMDFKMGLAGVKLDNKWKFIDRDGHEIGEQYDKVGSFASKLAPVCKNGKWGYLCTDGRLQIPATYDDARDFSEDLAAVKVNNKYGFIGATGEMKITPQFANIRRFSQGLCAVKQQSGKWVYIDRIGKPQFNVQFDDAKSFTCDRAMVTVNDLIGYIDKAGRYVVKPQYDFGFPFSDDLAIVSNLNWNSPQQRTVLMGAHLEGCKIHFEGSSKTEVYVPKDLDDALAELDSMLPEKAKHDISLIRIEEMNYYHHGFGMWLRNNWGLWKGLRLAKYMNEYGIEIPDSMSGEILEAYWKKVHGQPYALKKRAPLKFN